MEYLLDPDKKREADEVLEKLNQLPEEKKQEILKEVAASSEKTEEKEESFFEKFSREEE